MSKKSLIRFKGRRRKDKAGNIRLVGERQFRFPSINAVLQGAHSVLKFEAARHPEACGSSTFGFNDIYCRYKPFVKGWRTSRAAMLASKRANVHEIAKAFGPYAVCVDVSRAFDNIDVDILLSIVSNLLECDEYTIVKYSEILTTMGEIRVKHKSIAVPSNQIQHDHFSQRAASLSNGGRSRIFVDAVTSLKLKREDITKCLGEYLAANLVKIKKSWYYQCIGIAQGAAPSTLLCSLYLGHVERTIIDPIVSSCGQYDVNSTPPLSSACPTATAQGTARGLTALAEAGKQMPSTTYSGKPSNLSGGSSFGRCPCRSHSILLRMVDDWLLISRHKEVAVAFAERVVSGLQAFRVMINPLKTQVSFNIPVSIPSIKLLKCNAYTEGDGTRFIKWCGLLVDIERLELRADYTRYVGDHIHSTLNASYLRNPGLSLGSKLCHYLHPKVVPLLLDQEINSALTIRINIYQAFILGAMKFHWYIKSLSKKPEQSSMATWLLESIDKGIRYVADATRPRDVRKTLTSTISEHFDASLPKAHIEYLGLHAFYTVLSRKQSLYKSLLQLLLERLNAPHCAQCATYLKGAVDPRHSSIFDNVIY